MTVLRYPGPTLRGVVPVVLTLGNFDGVHLGHQAILRRTLAFARERRARAGLLTFHPHPARVLAPEKAPPLLVPLRGKIELLAASGIDFVWIARFSRPFSQMSPEGFVRDYMLARVDLAGMVVGDNVSFGYKRAGNASVLRELGARFGFEVEVVGPVLREDTRVSSTAVRTAVARGDADAAARLLGRPHAVWGRVEGGARRGREIGFPTANLRPSGGLLPADGVYAVRAATGGTVHAGVANVGFRPTFEEHRRTLEVHLFDFDRDLYRQRMRVDFVARLRDEVRFSSVDALVRQINRDVDQARRALGCV
jgi:riboflavin kinase/FMN adenylyltransferase